MKHTILVVEKSDQLRSYISAEVLGKKYAVFQLAHLEEACELVAGLTFDLVLVGLDCRNMSRPKFMSTLHMVKVFKPYPIIVLSDPVEADMKLVAMSQGVDYWMTKPFSPLQLSEVVTKLLEQNGQVDE